jgi:hypothetical protein
MELRGILADIVPQAATYIAYPADGHRFYLWDINIGDRRGF